MSASEHIGMDGERSVAPGNDYTKTYGKSLDVLVVDDDETNRVVLEIMLRNDGHRVYVARDGKEAVSFYQSTNPDVILMDIMMPVMNGYDAAQMIKALAGADYLPIIFLTALTDEQALAKCLEVGGLIS